MAGLYEGPLIVKRRATSAGQPHLLHLNSGQTQRLRAVGRSVYASDDAKQQFAQDFVSLDQGNDIRSFVFACKSLRINSYQERYLYTLLLGFLLEVPAKV